MTSHRSHLTVPDARSLALEFSASDSTFNASRQVSTSSVASGITRGSADGPTTDSAPSFSFDGHLHSSRRSELHPSCENDQRRNNQRIASSDISSPSQQSAISTDVTPSEVGRTSSYSSSLCQCPCRNCATCPLRVTTQSKDRKDTNKNCSGSNSNSNGIVQDGCGHRSESIWSRIKVAVVNFCLMEAEDNPSRFKYDCRVIPTNPLPKGRQRLLEVTELPFLILWIYFTYWLVIVTMTAPSTATNVWLSAIVAGLLVGIGLNANAYKSVTVPRRRGSIRHHRHARALLELRKYGESIDSVEMKIDWGMVIRFFIIPFGVSSLSALTNSNRNDFLLVFPREPFYLMIAILCPAVVVTCLAIFRIFLLWYLKVRWSLQVLFLNGALVD